MKTLLFLIVSLNSALVLANYKTCVKYDRIEDKSVRVDYNIGFHDDCDSSLFPEELRCREIVPAMAPEDRFCFKLIETGEKFQTSRYKSWVLKFEMMEFLDSVECGSIKFPIKKEIICFGY